MLFKSVIRLNGVARNPANGFPARLLGEPLLPNGRLNAPTLGHLLHRDYILRQAQNCSVRPVKKFELKVNREWHLICTDHNLLKLFRYRAGRAGKVRDKGAVRNHRESRGIAYHRGSSYCKRTLPPRSAIVAVGRSQLNAYQSAILRTGF